MRNAFRVRTISSSAVQRALAALFRVLHRAPFVVITRYSSPVAIALHPDEYERLVGRTLKEQSLAKHRALATWLEKRSPATASLGMR